MKSAAAEHLWPQKSATTNFARDAWPKEHRLKRPCSAVCGNARAIPLVAFSV